MPPRVKWVRTAAGRPASTVHPDELAPPGWHRLREMAWHLTRMLGGAWPRRPSRPGGRAAGARPSGLPRQRPDDDGAAPRARPVGLARSSMGAGRQSRRQGGHDRAARRSGWTRSTMGGRCCWSAGASAACSRASSPAPAGKGARGRDLGSPFSGDSRPTPTSANCTSGSRAMTSTSRRSRHHGQAAGADAGDLVARGTGSSRRARHAGSAMRSTSAVEIESTISGRCCGAGAAAHRSDIEAFLTEPKAARRSSAGPPSSQPLTLHRQVARKKNKSRTETL